MRKKTNVTIFKNTYANSLDSELFLPNYDKSKILGEVKRTIPKADTYHAHEKEWYPSYNNPINSKDYTTERKKELRDENIAINETIPSLVESGNLYKFIAADGQFFGTIPDSEPRIKKQITVNHKIPRRHSLEIYAPAGETLTVEIDSSLVDKNLKIIIGYPYVENTVFNEGYFAQMPNNKMPIMRAEFALNKTITKIGSPFGGMVILENAQNVAHDYDITISGGVDSPNYKLGVSTQQDWLDAMSNPSPYIWVITPYVSLVMPKVYVKNITDPYDAVMYWHKSASLSYFSMGKDITTQPVVMVYDSFVPVGGAVAYVGAYFCILPSDWCSSAMNYNSIMYSGNWGSLHEFNHHNQSFNIYSSNSWGVGENGEVTNNAMNAMSYILYTDIALTRSDSKVPSNGNWEVICDPYYNTNKLFCENAKVDNFESLGTNKVFAYADIMHAFGVEKFVHFLRVMYGFETFEGIDESNNLMHSKYLQSADGFGLTMCNFYKTDFVDYFKKVWKMELSADVIKEIKSKGYNEFFTLSNVYAAGIKGVETGRPYYMDIGVKTRVDFNKYTLCSEDNWQLENVTFNNSRGLLHDEGNGVYTFYATADFDEQPFELNYKVEKNGKTYKCTLAGKFVKRVNGIETTTYTYPDFSNRNKDIRTAVEEVAVKDYSTNVTNSNNFSKTVQTGDNLTEFKAKVLFDTDQMVTFMVYGDDKTLLKIGDEIAYTNSYLENEQNAINVQKTNKINMQVFANKPVLLEAYCLNGGGNGRMYLKYSTDGKTYQNIPDACCYNWRLSDDSILSYANRTLPIYKNRFDLKNNYLDLFYTDETNLNKYIKNIDCLDDAGNKVIVNENSSTILMYDGDMSTAFHTAWQGAITAYPHNYFIEFSQPIAFNKINFYFQNNGYEGYYAMGEYEIYTSLDGENYSLLCEGSNKNTTCILNFDSAASAKYVKLKIKSHANGHAFTSIAEIQFCHAGKFDNYNFYSSNDTKFTYMGNWQASEGAYINNSAAYSNDGKMEFYLSGTNLAIYSQNDTSKILIDGEEYTINANNQSYMPSFIIQNLKSGQHYVEIYANNFCFDAIKTSGTISSSSRTEIHTTGKLTSSQIVIVSVIIFVSLTALIVVPLYLKRKKSHG